MRRSGRNRGRCALHLKAIKIKGFKSFPDPVEVRLEPGVAVVVGPNGSGKSNISDAIVWAAGSLTPSELRAEKPDDVLFAGSAERAAVDACEVELLFDNTAGDGPLDYSELSITRRLLRGGEGQYLVNRAPVRRVDLVDLLSDLGLGHGMHSIIGQGRVDEVLTSSPADRRALIEEAAGLGKFKRRRHRSELKLARVQAQVERAHDVEAEVRKHLRPLAMQASAAERAEKLRGQIASLEARIAQLDLASVAERRAETESRRALVLEAQAQARAELERLLAEREAAEQQLTDIAGSREATLAGLYRLRGAVERLEIRREAVEGLVAELTALHVRSRESGSSEGRAELMQLERAQAKARDELQKAESLERGSELAVQQILAELAGLERIELARLESESRALVEQRTKVESDLTEAASLPEAAGRELVELAAAVERLSLRRESLGASLGRSRQELSEAEEQANSGAPSYQELERAEARAAVRERELAQECDRACERARHAAERLSVLERSIAEREGIPPAARALAEAGELLALTLLEVEPGYEQAVAAALAWRAAALIAPDPKRGLALLEKARREGLGNLAVVLADADRREPKEVAPLAGARPLAEFVSGDIRVRKLLEDIWLVPLEQLTEARSGIAVTREGHGYDAARGELWFAGSATEALMLELDVRRRALEGEVKQLFGEAAEAEKALGRAQRELKSAQKALAEVEPSRRRLLPAAFLARLIAAGSRLEQALQAAEGCASALREPLQDKAARSRGQVSRLSEGLQSLAAAEAELRLALSAARERLSQALRRAGPGEPPELGELAAEQVAERRNALAQRISAAEEALAGASSVAVAAREAARLTAEAHTRARVDRAHPPELFCARLSACGERLHTALSSISDRVEGLEAPLREQVEAGAGQAGELGATLRRLGAEEAALRDRSNSESERLALVGVELARLDSEAEDAERRLGGEEVVPAEGDDREELALKLERGHRRLEELGRVNPLAKEEYAEEKARLEELELQRADLERSLAELENLCAELTETVERRFAETYQLVSGTFEEVAATLFPGGEGRLRMTEPAVSEAPETAPETVEEAGIEIELRPVGKRVSKLSLLSGGEKSLGAICFLFSLFLAHPCPFYLLDEVEAALDEANIGRFVELLRRYADRAQFVVITHQKRTMEAADLLYGVTMSGDGISQIVSRRTPREPELALASA
ncbi:MAG: chromosome segregation protein SMC [Gaiellaceae bacterium]